MEHPSLASSLKSDNFGASPKSDLDDAKIHFTSKLARDNALNHIQTII